jgi:hypothetical protein
MQAMGSKVTHIVLAVCLAAGLAIHMPPTAIAESMTVVHFQADRNLHSPRPILIGECTSKARQLCIDQYVSCLRATGGIEQEQRRCQADRSRCLIPLRCPV